MATEDDVVAWHHQLNGHEFERTLGVREGQGKPGVLQFLVTKSQVGLSD